MLRNIRQRKCKAIAFSFIRCTFQIRSFFFFINRRDTLSHFSRIIVACEYSRFSLLRTFRQEERLRLSDSNSIYTDDVNQCLHNKFCSHGVPNVNLLDFMFILVDYS